MVCIAALAITGCAAPAARNKESWTQKADPDFVQLVNGLAGEDARDCGFHYYSRVDGENYAGRRGRECALAAMRDRRPFKYATARVPIDSVAVETLIGAPDGTLWYLDFGAGLDEAVLTGISYRCTSLDIDRWTFVITHRDCVRQPLP